MIQFYWFKWWCASAAGDPKSHNLTSKSTVIHLGASSHRMRRREKTTCRCLCPPSLLASASLGRRHLSPPTDASFKSKKTQKKWLKKFYVKERGRKLWTTVKRLLSIYLDTREKAACLHSRHWFLDILFSQSKLGRERKRWNALRQGAVQPLETCWLS